MFYVGLTCGAVHTVIICWGIVFVLTTVALLTISLATPFLKEPVDCVTYGQDIGRRPFRSAPAPIIFDPGTAPTEVAVHRNAAILPRDGVVDTVSRTQDPDLFDQTTVSIPQTIWQTARVRTDTPPSGTDLFNSWTEKNPTWDHYFLDDEEVATFVAAHYNDTVQEAFRDLPLGVMKADVFR